MGVARGLAPYSTAGRPRSTRRRTPESRLVRTGVISVKSAFYDVFITENTKLGRDHSAGARRFTILGSRQPGTARERGHRSRRPGARVVRGTGELQRR